MGNEQFRSYPTMPGFYSSVTSARNQIRVVVTEYLKLDISSDSSVSLSESPMGNACKDHLSKRSGSLHHIFMESLTFTVNNVIESISTFFYKQKIL